MMTDRNFACVLRMAAGIGVVVAAGCAPIPAQQQAVAPAPVYATAPQPVMPGAPVMQGQPMAAGQPMMQGQMPGQVAPNGPGALPPSIVRAFPDQNDPAQPHPGKAPTMQQLAAVGYTITPNVQPTGCVVNMVLNRDQFLRSLPILLQGGVLNHRLDPQAAQSQILSIAIAFSLQAAAVTAHEVMSMPTAPGSCHFHQSMGLPAANGQMQIVTLFDFDLDRNTDQSGPWMRLLTAGFTAHDAEGFIAAAGNFNLGPGVIQRIQQENRV
jgi:hypothetical protein